MESKGPAGPKAKLTVKQTQQVTEALLAGPVAHGYKTALWILPRVASLIEGLTGVAYHPGHVWVCWERVVSVANGPNAGRWNGMKRRSVAGSGRTGRH